MAQIIIPTPLRKYSDNQGTVNVSGGNVAEAIQQLTTDYPSLKQHLLDNEGKLRKFVRVYLGDEDIKTLDNEQTAVQEDTVISIIPAIAGGKN